MCAARRLNGPANRMTKVFNVLKQMVVILLASAALSGCAKQYAQYRDKTAADSATAGAAAQAKGNWADARADYADALADAQTAAWPETRLAQLHYEYGRSLGVTCAFEQAEHELNNALALETKSNHPFHAELIELGRLNLDQKKYPEAIGYFERALPELTKQDMIHTAPSTYADVLDDYALSLAGAKRLEDSARFAVQAEDTRNGRPKSANRIDRTPYGQRCPKA